MKTVVGQGERIYIYIRTALFYYIHTNMHKVRIEKHIKDIFPY